MIFGIGYSRSDEATHERFMRRTRLKNEIAERVVFREFVVRIALLYYRHCKVHGTVVEGYKNWIFEKTQMGDGDFDVGRFALAGLIRSGKLDGCLQPAADQRKKIGPQRCSF
jgi:hypothetical protein